MAESIWVILLDTSGSMGSGFTRVGEPTGLTEAGGWKRKIDAAKDLLLRRIEALRTPDVAVIQFTATARLLFLAPAVRFPEFAGVIRDLRAGGGTDLACALDEAASISGLSDYAQIKVLVISDGLTDADAAGRAADRLRAAYPQATIGVLLIDQTDEGDETAFQVATSDDVTYASSYAEVSKAVGSSAADMLASEVASVAVKQRRLVSDLLIAQDRPRLQTLLFEGSDTTPLNARTLAADVVPVLRALETLQDIADSSRGARSQIQVIDISQTSPVNASVSGIAKAVEVLDEQLTPWKREHAKRIADLRERKLKLQIAKLHAEAMSIRHKEELLSARVRKINAEAERLEIENDEKRIKMEEDELRKELLSLAKVVVMRLCSNADLDAMVRLQYETQALEATSIYVDTRYNVRTLYDDHQCSERPTRF